MKILFGVAALLAVATALWAYSPVPVQKTAAETELASALAQATSDSAKLKLAEDALAANPEDIPLGRIAQDVIMKLKADPLKFFQDRAQNSESIAAHYLAGVYAGNREDKVRESQWILKKDPHNVWGHLLAADAEWDKEKVNYPALRKEISAAIAADPSRPEPYMDMGYSYEDQNKWADARSAFEAARVADPSFKPARDQLLTAYAQLRDAKNYFDLAQGIFSDKPLELDLPRANGTGHVTTADLQGKNTVIEYWAYS